MILSPETITAIQDAATDRHSLVPFLGAGTSVALGLPSWKQLIDGLAIRAGITNANLDAPRFLQQIRNRIGKAAFESYIQKHLTVPNNSTTLVLQAIVHASPKQIVTTNLDNAIENAFRLAHKPIQPGAVLLGTPDDLPSVNQYANETQLLKLHGSVERPHSWVLTSDSYNKVYVAEKMVAEVIRHRIGIPLFIGFSLNDNAVGSCLELAKSWNRRSFALVHIDELTTDRRQELADLHVIPVPFESFDQIPVIIDEILGCSDVSSNVSISLCDDQHRLLIGAATVKIPNPQPSINNWSQTENGKKIIATLRNALHFNPQPSYIIPRSRRHNVGQPYQYRNDVVTLLTDINLNNPNNLKNADDLAHLDMLVCAILHYQDVFFDSLLPFVILHAKHNAYSFYQSVARNIKSIQDESTLSRFHQVLLNAITNPALSPKRIRDIAKHLALHNLHPAQQLPPQTITIDNLCVCRYLITRCQVGKLQADPAHIDTYSVIPHTLKNATQAQEIIDKLNTNYRPPNGQLWRLPTADEWRSFSGVAHGWPWGQQSPVYDTHAHLNYKDNNKPKGPIEVGCFLKGTSTEGLHDLIGNVYELLDATQNEQLVGGAWTTDTPQGMTIEQFRLFRKRGRGSGNIGIRPVYTK